MEQSWVVFFGGLAGGLGIGSAVTALVQHSLARRAKQQDLKVTELKEAFTGFLSALAKINENDASRENQVNFGLWVARIQLVASSNVSACIEAVKQTKANSTARGTAIDAMLLAMRKDLGIGQ